MVQFRFPPHTVCVVGMFHVFHRYTVSGMHINAVAYFASKVTLAKHKSVFMLTCRLTKETTLLCERNWIGQLSVTSYSESSVICVDVIYVSVEGFRLRCCFKVSVLNPGMEK